MILHDCIDLRMWNPASHVLSNVFYMFVFTDVESKLYNYITNANLQFLIPTVKLF